MHIINQGQWKEHIKFGKCVVCGCEFTLKQEEYENYVNAKTKYAEKEEWMFPPGNEKSLLKVECPCCRALVEMKTVELSHVYMVQDTDPYLYRGGI